MALSGLTPAFPLIQSGDAWLFHVCAFNNKHEIQLNIPHAELKARQIHHQPLMSKAAGYISASMKLKRFNRVRMLHGMVSLSSITTANMRTMDRIFLTNSQFEGKH